MKKRRRVMDKRRKNGLATHAYLLMRVTLYPLYYLIVPHAYQRKMNVMFMWILLKCLLWVKLVIIVMLLLSMIILYLFLLSKCMVLESFSYKMFMIKL